MHGKYLGGGAFSLIKISNAKVLGWEPSIRLERGLAVTFGWIAAQVLSKAPVS